jgi:hypothetical protein
MVPWLAASSLAVLADLVVTLYLMLHPEVKKLTSNIQTFSLNFHCLRPRSSYYSLPYATSRGNKEKHNLKYSDFSCNFSLLEAAL